MNRPPLPPITTTRSIHIPDPSSVLQYINSCPHKVPTATKTKRKTPLPSLPQNLDLPSSSNIPITFLSEPSLKSTTKKTQQHPTPSPSELSSFTFSQIYPKLELQRVHSTTTSSLTDLYHKDKDSDSTASTRVPRHNYNLRSQQQRNSQELQSLTSSSTNSRLLRQHAQPRLDTSSLSSSQPTIPSSLSLPFQITSGFETASLLSEEPVTISDSAANFSRVYSPSSIASNSSIQLPEYFLEEFSRPPSPNPHEYPIRVNSKIVRTLNEDPRYTVFPARFINNSSLSTQRKQRELRRLQEQQLTLKFEVEVTFNSLGPHSHVWCSQTFTSSRRYDRLQWGQNTLELPKILDPIECKNMIRYLNATDSEELNNYNIQSSFSLFDDSNYQNTIERIQTPFRVNKLNTWHIGTFVFDENYPDWIVSVTQNTYSRCRSDREHLITRQSWKLRIVNTAIDFDDKNNQLIHDGHILPCYHSDGFCKPKTKTPYTLTWFDEKFCLIFQLQEFIGRLT